MNLDNNSLYAQLAHLHELLGKCEQKIADLKTENESLSRELEYEVKLNQNLLRITKEKTNQERHKPNKKKHTGFVVMQSRESTFPSREKNLRYWQTLIQSPFKVEMEAAVAKTEIIDFFFSPKRGEKIAARIGILTFDASFIAKNTSDYALKQKMAAFENTCFQMEFTANYRSGFWEVKLSHTLPLGEVAEDLR